MTRAAVVGLGLIGGSAALALHARGYDRDLAARRRARERGIETAESLAEAVRDADLLLLAVPTEETPAVMREAAAAAPEALVTDAASLKKPITAAAAALPASVRFVGGHPIAGSRTPGLDGARADLFSGRPWLIVPTERSDAAAIAKIEGMVGRMGARPFVMDADRHDTVMMWVSHLPHVAAAALARVVHATAGEEIERFAGRGLLDTTRIAQRPSALALELALADPEALAAGIETMREELARIAENLRRHDAAKLLAGFQEAARARGAFENAAPAARQKPPGAGD
ncbi:MAG TPA: prephenate dehydrogenase [Thermoanaerobaculia bacterium]|nr:prephenate dehydrogenase [Thermoanaerobaculia bacterium]